MDRKNNFCSGWQFHPGEFSKPVPKITAKTGTCGGASNLTEEEGFVYRLHPYMAAKMRIENGNGLYNVAKQLEGKWKEVELPHDWSTEQNFVGPEEWEDKTEAVEAGYLLPETGYYRKRFRIPADSLGKRIIVEFEGITRDSTIWVNGCYINSHLSGYTGFACDITEYIFYGDEGENVILVKADNSLREGWWAEGAGICRPVWLYQLSPIHTARHGVFVYCKNISDKHAEIHVETEVCNDSVQLSESLGKEAEEILVKTQILSPEGVPIACKEEMLCVPVFKCRNTKSVMKIYDIRRWDLNTPVLYSVVTEIIKNGKIIDRVNTSFGIRDVRYTSEGLMLNGRIIEIKGVCVHQDFAGVGNALTPDIIRYRLARIKSMGANAYRCAHHPADEELLRACDEMGILVLNENRRFEMTKDSREDLEELIKGSRNHPCIFMWSLENEELMPTLPNGKRLLKTLVDYVHKLDPTRQCTVAGHYACRDEEYVKIPDVAGFNYDMDDAKAMRDAIPGLLTIASEDGSFVSTRGTYADNKEKGLCDCYDSGSYMIKLMIEQMGLKELPVGTLGGASSPNNLAYSWNHYVKQATFLGGIFVWSAFDYRGESFPWNWPAVQSGYGAMDICGFQKDAYYYWKSVWTDEPQIHLLPHWNWDEGLEVQVDVYTNCDEAELILNGHSLGRKNTKKGIIVSWNVEFEPGRLEVKGYRKNQEVVCDKKITAGKPVEIRLEKIYEGNKEILYRVEAIDKSGNISPQADIPFSAYAKNGRILGVGNGNPASHFKFSGNKCITFCGMALIVVRKTVGNQEPEVYLEKL